MMSQRSNKYMFLELYSSIRIKESSEVPEIV